MPVRRLLDRRYLDGVQAIRAAPSPATISIVCGGLKPRRGERLPDRDRDRLGLRELDEHHGRASKASPRHPGPERAACECDVDNSVELGARDLVVVAQGKVPGAQNGTDLSWPSGLEQPDHLEHAALLTDHMPGPASHDVVGDLSEGCSHVLRRDVAQHGDVKFLGSPAAVTDAVGVGRVAEGMLDAGVYDEQSQSDGLQVKWNLPHFERPHIKEQGMAGRA